EQSATPQVFRTRGRTPANGDLRRDLAQLGHDGRHMCVIPCKFGGFHVDLAREPTHLALDGSIVGQSYYLNSSENPT
ncbi:MAG: hypothetical protein KGI55_13895, partial [Gammaproteobacteria bacterium]|nr:hypothetical protein [Gammaproteobacteria bacterium]